MIALGQILLFAIIGYGLIVALLYVTQRNLVFVPDTTSPEVMVDPAAAPDRIETVSDDGVRVESWVISPWGESKATIVLFHGNAGNIGGRYFKAQMLARHGYTVVLAGYRGYGGNPGRPSEQGLYRDARGVLDQLNTTEHGREPLVLYGESLGTGVAVQMALEHDAAALILEAPYTSLPDVAAPRFPFIPVRLLMRDRFETKSKIGDVAAPLLILHGENDLTIPLSHGQAVYEAAAEPKERRWIADAGHVDLYEYGVKDEIVHFLDKSLGLESRTPRDLPNGRNGAHGGGIAAGPIRIAGFLDPSR